MTTSESHGAISGSRVSDEDLKKSIHARAEEVASNIIGFTPSEAHSNETQNDFLEYTEIVEEGMTLLLAAALSLRSEPSEPVAWQPIETAPDDTVLLGKWYEDDCNGYNGESRWLWIASGNFGTSTLWIDVDDSEVENPVGFNAPTHWKPLPASPQPGASS